MMINENPTEKTTNKNEIIGALKTLVDQLERGNAHIAGFRNETEYLAPKGKKIRIVMDLLLEGNE